MQGHGLSHRSNMLIPMVGQVKEDFLAKRALELGRERNEVCLQAARRKGTPGERHGESEDTAV